MDPIAIQIGPIAIRYYGLMYVLAFFVGGWLLGKEVRRKGIPLSDDERWNFLALVYVCGILGARIYYVLFNWAYYSQDLWEIPAIWHGGLAIHGGMIGGALAGWWYITRHRLSFLRLADAGAPSVILGQAFGRFGNFMNGETHGRPTDMPWGVVFPPESPAGQEFGPAPLHPTMLYEMALNLLIFALLWSIRKRPFQDGFIFLLYLVLYSIDRSIVSSFRAEDLMIGPIRAPHAVSAGLVLLAAAYIIRKRLWRLPDRQAGPPDPRGPGRAGQAKRSSDAPQRV
ncbi:MAG: prolipoprotein diacylglyceryl transferase [Nitrospirota bacterium]